MLEQEAAASVERNIGQSATTLWLAQVARQTDLSVQSAIGAVSDAVQVLMHAAYKAWPLSGLAANFFAAKGMSDEDVSRRSLLIQDLSSGQVFPKIEGVYANLQEFLHEDAPRCERLRQDGRLDLEGGLHSTVDDSKRPSTLYQVAVDLSAQGELTVSMLEEIIHTVGKVHAYAIVTHGPAVVPMLSAIVEQEKLTSYLIAKDPDCSNIPSKLQNTMHMIMQPTLVLLDGGAQVPPERRASARVLEASITRYACPDMANVPSGEVHSVMIDKVVDFFRESSWVGCLSTDGTDQEKPVITRLTGGINAWKGLQTKQEEKKKTAKEKAKKCWARIRICYKLGVFEPESTLMPGFLAPIQSGKPVRGENKGFLSTT